MKKLIITSMEILNRPCVVCAGMKDREVWDLRVFPQIPSEHASRLDQIYVGQVENISNNLQAAFIRIAPDVRCFFPLKEAPDLIYAGPHKEGAPLRPGDQVLVQVRKEAMKGKPDTVSAVLSITGRNIVLENRTAASGVSRKLDEKKRDRLKAWAAAYIKMNNLPYGLVLRTNAGSAATDEIEEEAERLRLEMDAILNQGIHRSLYSCVYRPVSPVMAFVRDFYTGDCCEIVTDLPSVYEEARDLLASMKDPDFDSHIRLYQDPLLPLSGLYSLKSVIESALHKKVWLPEGGFIVIEQTEAAVVIDVNTGKNISHADTEELFLKTNLSAAREISRQMRLRSLSGIILVDFINMQDPRNRQVLADTLRELLSSDTARASLIDITPLQIAEITRQKKYPPLRESLPN